MCVCVLPDAFCVHGQKAEIWSIFHATLFPLLKETICNFIAF